MILDLLYVLAVAWILYRAVSQYRVFVPLNPGAASPPVSLTVIIPARNEERNIAPCLQSLTAQQYPPDKLQILVVDDSSTDATVAQAQRAGGGVRVLRAAALSPGWTGKSHACWTAIAAATGEYLCFIDADVRALPGLLQTAVAAAAQEHIDLLSLEPFQEMKTLWERLIFPAGFLLLAATQDLRSVSDPATPAAAANGQFILIRRAVYDAIGGHAAVAGAVAEDSALATLVKRHGYRVALRDGSSLLHARMYHTLPELWQGLSKNIPIMLQGLLPALLAVVLSCALAIASVALPLAAALDLRTSPDAPHIAAFAAAVAASLALLFTHIGIARHFRFPIPFAFLFPLAYLLGAALVATSIVVHLCGRVSWKGRTYSPSSVAARAK